MSAPASLTLAGAGKMGGAMLEGWLRLGLDGKAVSVIDPHLAADIANNWRRAGVRVNPVSTYPPEVLVLGIKPQMLVVAAPGLAPLAGPNTLVVSILAGKTLADLARALPHAGAIVRAMPNLPAFVGRGIAGAFGSAALTAQQRASADYLLRAVGMVEWLASEDEIDAVTAISGSGPAYVFYLTECLAKAAEGLGLEAGLAMRLARATVEGAGELLHLSPKIPAAQLRVNVTSPGGTTAAALEVLMSENGLAPLMQAAVSAAKRRAGELSS